jgi:hypothetical protein
MLSGPSPDTAVVATSNFLLSLTDMLACNLDNRILRLCHVLPLVSDYEVL